MLSCQVSRGAMSQEMLLIAIILSAGLGLIGWVISYQLRKLHEKDLDKQQTKDIVNQVFGQLAEKVIQQTKNVLESDKEAIYKDNQIKTQVIEKLVTDLKEEIHERQDEIRRLEQDRNKKFGEISVSIKEHQKITKELKSSTESLSKALSNNQARGQWGERIIEDILVNAGLVESVHYQKQKNLGSTSLRPDITLLLPNNRTVAVDVKFPYQQIQKLTHAKTSDAKKEIIRLFEKDVKQKIVDVQKRGYINQDEGTLDYAIIFVPNELLFSFINQNFPNVIDEAMNKKIMLVSPFTFLVVARTVMESYRNFMIENNLRHIIGVIGEFVKEWERFITEFASFDEKITKLRTSYDKIAQTRVKQMSRKITKIHKYEQGQLSEEMEQVKIVA